MLESKGKSYLNYLALLRAMEKEAGGHSIDPIEDQLLDQVMINQSQGRMQLVGDLIHLDAIGSQATLHSRIKRLAQKGYLQLKPNAQDARKKQVRLSAKAIRRFVKLSSCIERAASSVK
jgi:DNA-binding MarR family transcriptional regulator